MLCTLCFVCALSSVHAVSSACAVDSVLLVLSVLCMRKFCNFLVFYLSSLFSVFLSFNRGDTDSKNFCLTFVHVLFI